MNSLVHFNIKNHSDLTAEHSTQTSTYNLHTVELWFCIFFGICLLVALTFCISATNRILYNYTTNEMINFASYDYITFSPSYSNRFDRGYMKNCLTFFNFLPETTGPRDFRL